jgi:hypothetical protein
MGVSVATPCVKHWSVAQLALAPAGGTLMAGRSSLRSQLYRAARDLGNVQAAAKGPGSYAERMARRKVYRTTNGMASQLLRSFGLMGTHRR